jgi:hypothetical protein
MTTRPTVRVMRVNQPTIRTRIAGERRVIGLSLITVGSVVVMEPSASGNHMQAKGRAIMRRLLSRAATPPTAQRVSHAMAKTAEKSL